jgi:hypothetical protein
LLRGASKYQFRPKLDVAIPGRARDIPERRGAERSRWVVEVRVVEQRESLKPKLEPQALLDGEILEE